MKSKKPSFEEALPVIDSEIAKRKHKWNLTSLAWMDFDDVSQIIRIHIYKKWHQYESSRPIQPWLNSIITNQIRNLIRNNYSNYARPCLRCGAARDNKCDIYDEQCSDCPLYAKWQKRKQAAHFIKIPVSIENHTNEIGSILDDSVDVTAKLDAVHEQMKKVLKPIEYKVYHGLFVLHNDESLVAKSLGYISNEKGRSPGYRQIKNIRQAIIQKARKCLQSGEIDF